MLDSDSGSTSSIDYDEVYSLFTKNDLEDVLIKTAKIPMTVKEECEAIEKLKSENFDLKWRLYLLNQDYKELLNANGFSKQSSENGSIRNLTRRETSIKDKEIKMLRTVLEQRVKQLSSLKNYYDEIIKSKDNELDDLKMEKTSAYVTELECNAATLYEILEKKDCEMLDLKERFENQKNEIKKLKDDLKTNLNNLNNLTNQPTVNKQTNDTTRLSLEQTRKELDQVKIELKNLKIMEKERLENYARIVTENEVEIELLKEQIVSLKERENFLQKENEQLQRMNEQLQRENEELVDELQNGEDKLANEINQLKLREDHLLKENQEYERLIQEDYLMKMKQHLLKEKNQQTELDSSRSKKADENSNLIRNSIDVQELFKYTKSLEERLDYQDRVMRKNELEKEQLIVSLNSLKEKKKNLENIISKQLAKTNHLLATAKQNLIDK